MIEQFLDWPVKISIETISVLLIDLWVEIRPGLTEAVK